MYKLVIIKPMSMPQKDIDLLKQWHYYSEQDKAFIVENAEGLVNFGIRLGMHKIGTMMNFTLLEL